MIKLLDCTLRDGGYIINWAFGKKKAKLIIEKLLKSKIDFIEIGFLRNKKTRLQTTIFQNIDEAKRLINGNYTKFFVMIKQNDFDIKNLKDACQNDINIRYIFKKEGAKKALSDCKKIIKKGYNLFINPVFINDYKSNEFYFLIKELSKLNPKGISIVDSTGSLNKEIFTIYKNLDSFLNKDISICFHLHNNSEHALINAKEILKINTKRNIIIDCTLSGMGRGAGNICSELMAQIINENYNGNYNQKIIDSIIENELDKFYQKNPWGNSYPYYLGASYNVHPDYVTFLIKNKIDENYFIEIFKNIPDCNKSTFDSELIAKLVKNINANDSCNN